MPPKAQQHKKPTLINQPFPHLMIPNFLAPQLYKKALDVYNKLQFKQKKSDLFNFFQTNELNENNKLKFFRDQLDKQFWELEPMKSGNIKKQDTFYNIFASYYFNGHYLLCHDDIVEDRLYAFSYYLEDHPSGDLVLFNQDATKQAKRIKVKKNTLAIFEVSDVSYHQVDYTKQDGRKAITGWFNIKGLGSKRKSKQISAYVPNVPTKQVLQFPLPPAYYADQYFQLMDLQYQFNVKKTTLQGPFFQRRVHKIQIDPPVIFTLQGYKVHSVQFYHFKEGDYLLLNDPINSIKAQEIIDVFVTHLPPGFEQSQDDMLVKIVQPDEEPCGIYEIDDSLFVINRGKKQYYVDRVHGPQKSFMLAHYIYFKDSKKKATKNHKNSQEVVIVPGKLKSQNTNKNKTPEKANKKMSKQKKQVSKTKTSKTKTIKKQVKIEKKQINKKSKQNNLKKSKK